MRSTGDMLTRLESNIVIRDTVNAQLISIVLDTMSVVVYLGILVRLSPACALITTVFGLAQVGLILTTDERIHELLKRGLEAQSYLTEALVGIVTIKAAGIERHVRTH